MSRPRDFISDPRYPQATPAYVTYVTTPATSTRAAPQANYESRPTAPLHSERPRPGRQSRTTERVSDWIDDLPEPKANKRTSHHYKQTEDEVINNSTSHPKAGRANKRYSRDFSASIPAPAPSSSTSTTISLDTPPARPNGTRPLSSKLDFKGGYSSGSVPPRVPNPPPYVPQTAPPPPIVPQTAPPRKKKSSSDRYPKGDKPFSSAHPRIPPNGDAGAQAFFSQQDARESYGGYPVPPHQTTASHTKPYIPDRDDDDASRFGAGHPRPPTPPRPRPPPVPLESYSGNSAPPLQTTASHTKPYIPDRDYDDASRFGAGHPRPPTPPGSRRPLVPLEPSRRRLRRAEEVSKFWDGVESGVWQDDGPRDRRRRRSSGWDRE